MNEMVVIIPFYFKDNISYFQKSLDSLINQTYKQFDIIVSIDGPILNNQREYFLTVQRKKIAEVIFYEENRGLPSVLNDSIKRCIEKGYKYIARMDADDICVSERLEKQIQYLERNESVSMVGTQVYLIDNKGNVIGKKYVNTKATFKTLHKRIDINHATVLFRASFFDQFGFYDDYYLNAQDWDLWLRATKKGAILHTINEPLYYVRYDKDVIKRRKKGQKYRIHIKLKHFSIFRALVSIVPNIVVMIMPGFILGCVLKIKNKLQSNYIANFD